ncbi:MAG TPA: hypothetical protein PLP61_12545, partial [Nocardioides sp.]|uniref:hypothetical protein n=1 Tax=Nocardioides sp. TaxID=35761 RepID=UPI002C2D12FE
MATAPELHSRGVTAINSGRLRTARTLLERAQERTDEADGELRARIEASLAFVTAETGDAAGALALCERALGRAGLSAETRGVVESQRALLLMRRGETVAALSAFEAAIGSLADNPAELGKAHLNRGGVYLQQGQPDRALVDFAAASEHLESAGLTTEAAMSRHNLGYAQLLLGNLVDALREMDAAREVLAPMSPLTRAICDQDRAEVLMAAGLSTEGRHALREAARTYGLRRFHQRRGEAELVLARSVLLADPAESLAAARAARRRFTRTG